MVIIILHVLSISISLHLFGQVLLILIVFNLVELMGVLSNHVLLSLLPGELLSFKLAHLLDVSALFLETIVGQAVGLVGLASACVTLRLGMIINSERSLGSEEVRVGVVVEVTANLFPVEGESDVFLDILISLGFIPTDLLIGINAETVENGVSLVSSCFVCNSLSERAILFTVLMRSGVVIPIHLGLSLILSVLINVRIVGDTSSIFFHR